MEEALSLLLINEAENFGVFEICLAILLPLFLCIPVSWVYRLTQSHNNFAPSFLHALFLFSALSGVLTLIIGNSVARAFGLIGALSIIRFRNALKEPIDGVYIFWALTIGMACGTGLYFTASLLTLICALAAISMHLLGVGKHYYGESLLTLTVSQGETKSEDIEKLLKKNVKSFKQVEVIDRQGKNQSEWIYSLKTLSNKGSGVIRKDLSKLSGVEQIKFIERPKSLFAD